MRQSVVKAWNKCFLWKPRHYTARTCSKTRHYRASVQKCITIYVEQAFPNASPHGEKVFRNRSEGLESLVSERPCHFTASKRTKIRLWRVGTQEEARLSEGQRGECAGNARYRSAAERAPSLPLVRGKPKPRLRILRATRHRRGARKERTNLHAV